MDKGELLINRINNLSPELKNIIKLYYGGGAFAEELKDFFKLTMEERALNHILNPLEYLRENRSLTSIEAADFWEYGYRRNRIRDKMKPFFKDNEAFINFLNNIETRDFYFNLLDEAIYNDSFDDPLFLGKIPYIYLKPSIYSNIFTDELKGRKELNEELINIMKLNNITPLYNSSVEQSFKYLMKNL